MEKQKNIPQLRFPEFEGVWKQEELDGIASKIQDGTHFSPKLLEEGKYLYITSKNVKNGYIDLTDSSYVSYEDHKNIYKRCDTKKGDVLLTKDGTIGQASINTINEEISLLSSVAFIRSNDKNSNEFICQLLLSPTGQKEIKNSIAGQALKRITLTKIKNFRYYFPTLPEQQKIASFFTAIDLKITQLKHKKDLLEHYKKGVMQKIFSQEIRFKDDNGQEYPKWEKKKLRDVATKKSSNISANKIEKNIGDYIIYGAAGILRNINFYEEENDYISIVKDGAGVGRLMYCKGKSSVLGTMEIIKPLSKINTYYLYCLLSNIDFAKYVIGSTIPHIYFKDYSHEICSIPDLSEQTKIANFLSAIDDKINNTQKQIEKAEVWKKGLMQQMFV